MRVCGGLVRNGIGGLNAPQTLCESLFTCVCVAACYTGTTRTDVQCLHRYNKVLKPGLQKGAWTEAEDDVVRQMVAMYGVGNVKWSAIAEKVRLSKENIFPQSLLTLFVLMTAPWTTGQAVQRAMVESLG
jgi:hypothetical protein